MPKPGKVSPVLKSVDGLLSQSRSDAPLSVVLYYYKCRTNSSYLYVHCFEICTNNIPTPRQRG